jgi:hypothetical protein
MPFYRIEGGLVKGLVALDWIAHITGERLWIDVGEAEDS